MGTSNKLKVDPKSFLVESPQFCSLFKQISPGLVRMHHKVERYKTSKAMDVFSDFWGFAVSQVPPDGIKAKHGKKWISASGSLAFFAPCFSIVEWMLKPGVLSFEALVSTLPLPDTVFSEPIVFSWDNREFPDSYEKLINILSNQSEVLRIGIASNPCQSALKTKQIIDENYQDEMKISDISKKLGMTRESLSRVFKRYYGMPPHTYRNRLRISQSIITLLSGKHTVTEVGFDVGFQDLSRYHKQFRKQMSSTPSKFRFQ